MKGNINKLAVFVIIAAIAMFTAVATAWDNDHHDHHCQNAICGKYAFTGTGSCLLSINGFNNLLQPNGGALGPWFMGPLTLDNGVLTFNKDGTGSVRNIFRTVDVYSPGMGAPPDAMSSDERWDFNYILMDSGKITITYVKGSYVLDFWSGPFVGTPMTPQYFNVPSWDAVLSPDGKILYVSIGPPSKYENTADKANNIPTGMEAICSIIIQGFRISP